MLAGPAQTADVITVLNVHKPRGLTPYGQQKLSKEPKGSTIVAPLPPDSRPRDPTPLPAEVGLLSRNEDLMSRREIETTLGVCAWGEACAGASRDRRLATQPGRRAPA